MSTQTRAGWITVVLWAGTFLGWIGGADPLFMGAFLRTAVVMTLLWFAWPQLARLPRWIFFAVPAACIAAAFNPRILLVLIPALLLYGVLRPAPKKTR